MIDKFCDWFEGEFDNWTQAASNPTKWAHIIVKHEKISEYKYHTSSRYSYMQKPYREQTVEIEYVCPELIIVHNPACDIVLNGLVYILRENRNQTVNGMVNRWKVKQDYMRMNTILGM